VPRSAAEVVTVSVSTSANGIVPASLMRAKNSPRLNGLTGALLLLRIVAHQPLELQLHGDVTRAITRLPQVEKLLERHQIACRVGPIRAASIAHGIARPAAGSFDSLARRATPDTCRAVSQHDPDDFPTPWVVVIESGLHQCFLHRCGEAFGAAVKHVVQRRQTANRTAVGSSFNPRQLDPVVVVGEQAQWFAGNRLLEGNSSARVAQISPPAVPSRRENNLDPGRCRSA